MDVNSKKFRGMFSPFDINDQNNCFITSTPSHCASEQAQETVDKPKELLELIFSLDFDLQLKKVEEKERGMEIVSQKYH